jgi:hypothetical protein
MKGKTKETAGHIHTWRVVHFDGEFSGYTDTLEGHSHEVTFKSRKDFSDDFVLTTTVDNGHSHEVVIPGEIMDPERGMLFRRISLPESESPYGPDGSDPEEDELKRLKRKIDDDGLPIRSAFQGKYTDKKWDGSKGRFDIDQLRKSVPEAMRAWGDKQETPSGEPSKANYKLPYKEPDGTINVNGVRNALARASSVKDVPENVISKAVAELQRVLEEAKKAGFSALESSEMPRQKERMALIRGERLFQTGEWNGQEVDLDFLKSLAANYDRLKLSFEPPIKTGHNDADHSKFFGEGSAGWVHNLRVDGTFLYGDLEVPMSVYDEWLATGKVRYKSIEIIPDFRRNGTDYGPVMVGLALLGRNFPAVNDLGAVALPFAQDDTFQVIKFTYHYGGEEDVTEAEKKALEDQMAQMKIDFAEVEKEKKALADEKAASDAKIREAEAKFAEADKQVKAMAEAKTKAEDSAKHLSAQLYATEANSFAAGLKAAGKLLPRQEEDFVALYLSLNKGMVVKTFSEKNDDGTMVETKKSQLDLFKDLFNDIEKQVDLDTQSAADDTPVTPDVPKPGEASETPTPTKGEVPADMPHAEKFNEYLKNTPNLSLRGADVVTAAAEIKAKNEGMTDEQALRQAYAQKMAK